MMDDAMLNAQCRSITNCINGLSASLSEQEANSGIVEIVTEVQKLLQCFKLLGTAYMHELVKKCREVEAKDAELKALEAKNEEHRLVSRERLKTKSEELDRSLNDVANLTGELEESRRDGAKAREELGTLTASNETLSRLLMKDREQLEEMRRSQSRLKDCLHLIASKHLSAACDTDHELLQTECRGFDSDTTSYLTTLFQRSVKLANTSVETQTDPMLTDEMIREGSMFVHASKRPRVEYITLDSDSDDESNSSQRRNARIRK